MVKILTNLKLNLIFLVHTYQITVILFIFIKIYEKNPENPRRKCTKHHVNFRSIF